MPSGFQDELIQRLQYFDGHSDTLGLFADPGFLRRAAAAVVAPFGDTPVRKVAGIEARGFVLASAVALELDAAGARYAGLALLVDQLTPEIREQLGPVAAVALASQLRG